MSRELRLLVSTGNTNLRDITLPTVTNTFDKRNW